MPLYPATISLSCVVTPGLVGNSANFLGVLATTVVATPEISWQG